MNFRATLWKAEGKNATGIKVPDEIVVELNSGRRPAVRVTFNGFTYRTTVATMGSVYMMPVSAEVREKAGVQAGDSFEVEIELDTDPRKMDAPADLSAAFDYNPNAMTAWSALSYSKQRAIVLNIEGTKNPETRARRVAKAIEQLSTE
ncbi:MAG: YdeI/OmpD-associated family protein [Thermomicrobiales bacterium]